MLRREVLHESVSAAEPLPLRRGAPDQAPLLGERAFQTRAWGEGLGSVFTEESWRLWRAFIVLVPFSTQLLPGYRRPLGTERVLESPSSAES